jgi:uncharacterized protein (TIGR03032 family)
MNQPTPFSCSYTPQIPELLFNLNCSIALTTYQAGKLIFLSPRDKEVLVQLPRTFDKPMGIAIHPSDPNKISLACKSEIISFKSDDGLAKFYPKSPSKYDAMFMPRLTYHTNFLDIHDLEYGKDGLYGVNTLFSSIVKFNESYSFEPYWKPSFVSELASEDRCHLNGMIMKDGKPKYGTAFNQGNTPQSWRSEIISGGVLIDIDTNDIIADQLEMPHSPKQIGNKIYCLLSALGQLISIDIETGKREVIVELNAFVRGMDFYGDYLFIGMSKLRENLSTFKELIPNIKNNRAGIAIIHLPTQSFQGEIVYQNSVEEIYDVKIIADKIRPNIVSPHSNESKAGLTIPDTSFWAKI